MKKLSLTIMFILAVFFAIDRAGGGIMRFITRHSQSVQAPKICHLAEKGDEDVLLLGTSRCHCHYVPHIIADSLQMTVYNGGVDASNSIYSHYMALCFVLEHHKPKVVCLELMTSDYQPSEQPFGTIARFAPYYGQSKRADSLFAVAGMAWRYRLSHLYRYNATSLTSVTGMIQNMEANNDNGFYALKKTDTPNPTLEKEQTDTSVDCMKLDYVQRFINLCRQNGISLVFTISPRYSIVSSSHYDILKTIAKSNGVPFLDYHTQGLFLDNPEYFRDPEHLWEEGARRYSSVFASDLKRILSQQDTSY